MLWYRDVGGEELKELGPHRASLAQIQKFLFLRKYQTEDQLTTVSVPLISFLIHF